MTKIIRSHSISKPEARLRLPELLYEEFLRYGTGGTCFSMTYFMQTILRSCKFNTYAVIADRPLAPNTHCLSIININGKKYILDPGFMIDKPLPLTKIPTKHLLRHNTIIIGAKDSIPIPERQMKYFEEYRTKRGLDLFHEISSKNEYIIAMHTQNRTDIRYLFKDQSVNAEKFLDFWLSSFNWPTLRNISITTATNNGYIYARNNFLRTSMKDGKKQERIKKDVELKLGKTFNIDWKIITTAFEILNGWR